MRTHLVGGTVIDGNGTEPLEDGVVCFDGDRIVYVGAAAGAPSAAADDTVVDCVGQTVLPGLIDAHVHHIYSRYRNIGEIALTSLEGSTVKAAANARLWLEAGFTTVRDVGTRGNIAVAMRDAIADGVVTGPRVVASGQILCTTGGLADIDPPWADSGNTG